MMKKSLYLVITALFISFSTWANVNLPAIFSDNMVLQRNADVKIWGWARPFEEVTITPSWTEEQFKVKPTNGGYWEVTIPTNEAKGPQTLHFKGWNQLELKNILLGEVWLVSGQSNMEWTMRSGIKNKELAKELADNENIRFFTVVNRTAEAPQIDLKGNWAVSSPTTYQDFSAVAYFFAHRLQEELGEDVPVGIIHSSWGGSSVETWMPTERVMQDEKFEKALSMLPEVPWAPYPAGCIYNAMLAPIIGYPIQGVLWYQGEANVVNAEYYHELLAALIKSWRDAWDVQFPFYFAQIAPYKYEKEFEGVKVRDAQRRTVLSVPKTAMVMTSDIGNVEDIHPRNKLDVGKRFGDIALNQVYGKDVAIGEPGFDGFEVKGSKAILKLKNNEGLYVAKENNSSQFELAGADGKFYAAKMKLKNNQIILSSKEVKEPVHVRYSWGNTSTSNIFNALGLPLSSFTTEDYEVK